jgi:hypothetical protein
MRKVLVALLLLVLAAGAAEAGVIRDIQQGLVPVNSMVTITSAMVTGVRPTGLFLGEIPNGPYAGIWVETGAYAHGSEEGDLCTVTARYIEAGGISVIDFNGTPAGSRSLSKAPTGLTYPSYCVTARDLNLAPAMYESGFLCLTDGLIVTTMPDPNGEWLVQSHEYGHIIRLDDFWHDPSGVQVGQCYDWAGGIWFYDGVNWKLEPFAGERGIGITDCAVPTDLQSFGRIKALYR